MALKFTQKYKKQKYLLGALLLIILATVLVWWIGFYSPPQEKRKFSSSFPKREIRINFEVLEQDIFEDMQPFVIIDMPEKVGKENPFFRISPALEGSPVEEAEEAEE